MPLLELRSSAKSTCSTSRDVDGGVFKLKSGLDRVSKTIVQYESTEAPRLRNFWIGSGAGRTRFREM